MRLAHGLRRSWWRLRKPEIRGCRIIALDAAGRVLLIRHSYGSGKWMPPGGGVGRGEAPVAAASRELAEETACTLHDAVEIATVVELLHGARNRVHVVAGRTLDDPVPDGREVIEAAFFALDALPERMPAIIRAGLAGWVTAAKAGRPAPLPPSPPPPPAPTA